MQNQIPLLTQFASLHARAVLDGKKKLKISSEQNETFTLIGEASCLDLYNVLITKCKKMQAPHHNLQNSSQSLVSTCCPALCLDAFNSRTSWITIIIIIIIILIVITAIIIIIIIILIVIIIIILIVITVIIIVIIIILSIVVF